MSVTVDDKEVLAAFRKGKFNVGDMLDVEKPIALHIVNKQKLDVPKDTHATEKSIGPEIQSASAEQVIDHIGPGTTYAPSIEFGVISKPNYPIQPFVRTSAYGYENSIKRVATESYKAVIKKKWPS